jgi:hypothetical protein
MRAALHLSTPSIDQSARRDAAVAGPWSAREMEMEMERDGRGP